MIINTGMRTDIPAFYSRWLRNRLRAGFVLVRNPYNEMQVTRYILSPDVVDLIGFCTKNPIPMLPYMDALSAYGQYWFVSITPYGKDIEPGVPDKKQVIHAFQKLSTQLGMECVGWRYDPILINAQYTAEKHLLQFEKIASALAGYTKTCVISFIDLYPKVRKNFPEIQAVSKEMRLYLGTNFIRIATKYGMTIKPCGEGTELAAYGADCSGCMTLAVYEQALHCKLRAPKIPGARKECACFLNCDIGAYNSCGHFCRYCYANGSRAQVTQTMARHNPDSPFLIGGGQSGDVIHDAQQKSWKDIAISLF